MYYVGIVYRAFAVEYEALERRIGICYSGSQGRRQALVECGHAPFPSEILSF